MDDMALDPIDGHLSFADEPVRAATRPGALLAMLAMVSLVVCVVGFAVRQIGVAVSAASLALLAAGAALSWLSAEARRLRDARRFTH